MVCVKTAAPVRKSEMFDVMQRINAASCVLPVRVGDIIVKDIADGVDLVATGNFG